MKKLKINPLTTYFQKYHAEGLEAIGKFSYSYKLKELGNAYQKFEGNLY